MDELLGVQEHKYGLVGHRTNEFEQKGSTAYHERCEQLILTVSGTH